VTDAPSGDQAAFRQLFEAHAEPLRRYARRFLRSREAAEDLVQDVSLRLWRVWGRVERGPALRAYLYSATRAQALNALRRERREERALPRGVLAAEPALPAEGEARLRDDAIVRAIERALLAMPPRQREVAALRLRDQLTTREIAERLAISPRTVEVHVARATRTLRELLPRLLAGDDAPPDDARASR
jgi:RNA polymerase sigma-70 factor (ECF subfamily)